MIFHKWIRRWRMNLISLHIEFACKLVVPGFFYWVLELFQHGSRVFLLGSWIVPTWFRGFSIGFWNCTNMVPRFFYWDLELFQHGSKVFLLGSGIVPTKWYFVLFHFIGTNLHTSHCQTHIGDVIVYHVHLSALDNGQVKLDNGFEPRSGQTR